MERNTRILLTEAIRIVLFLIPFFVFQGCQKVIEVDLNDATPKIVIEGLINDRRGPYGITVTKTGSYFNEASLPPVTGANVYIKDNLGFTDTLREASPGVYLTGRTKGVPGKTYTLTVVAENIVYSGTSTMLSHVNIDSLKLVKSEFQRFDFSGNTDNALNMEIHGFFKDPPEKNYYRVKVFKNDSINTQSYRLYDDQYTNGEEIDLRVSRAEPGASYRIELLSIDKATYGYYRTLDDLLYINPFFGSTPANPNTNLSNGALGYFGACAVSSKTIVITDALINKVK